MMPGSPIFFDGYEYSKDKNGDPKSLLDFHIIIVQLRIQNRYVEWIFSHVVRGYENKLKSCLDRQNRINSWHDSVLT